MTVILKEPKECRTTLKSIIKKEMIKPVLKLNPIFKQTEELIAITGKSISPLRKTRENSPGLEY